MTRTLLSLLFATGLSAAAAPESIEESDLPASPRGPVFVRQRTVPLSDVVHPAPSAVSVVPPERVTLTPFPGITIEAVQDSIQLFDRDSYSWVGHVRGERDSSLVLAFSRGRLAGSLRTGTGTFRMLPATATEAVVVQELAPGDAGEERLPIPVNLGSDAGPRRGGSIPGGADGGDEIDLLVVYTPAARAAASGRDAIEALVQLEVTEANLALQNSDVEPRLRLVQVSETGYRESGDIELDLELLQGRGDGALEQVHALRARFGADLVQLVVEGADDCGIAYIMEGQTDAFADWAFSITDRACLGQRLSLVHELGHNLGCNHAPEDPTSPGAFDFSFGYKDPDEAFRTVMAYAPGRRVLHFSNPAIRYSGRPTGREQQDNARTIDAVGGTVANFTASVTHAALASPRVGTRLDNATVEFRWTAVESEIEQWWLYVGTERGKADLFDSGPTGALGTWVSPLPTGGKDLYVRLWYLHEDVWLYRDYRYLTAVAPRLMARRDTRELVLQWDTAGVQVSHWWLEVGSGLGARDLFEEGLGEDGRSARVATPPAGAVYVRLWYFSGGRWKYTDLRVEAPN